VIFILNEAYQIVKSNMTLWEISRLLCIIIRVNSANVPIPDSDVVVVIRWRLVDCTLHPTVGNLNSAHPLHNIRSPCRFRTVSSFRLSGKGCTCPGPVALPSHTGMSKVIKSVSLAWSYIILVKTNTYQSPITLKHHFLLCSKI